MLDEKAPFGISDRDPKFEALRDLGDLVTKAGVQAVLIGGLAVAANGHVRTTVDVDILVARDEVMRLKTAAAADARFRVVGVNRYFHAPTQTKIDICVEGDFTRSDSPLRFPHPSTLQTMPLSLLPPVALLDLIRLKLLSHRSQDDADIIALLKRQSIDEIAFSSTLPDDSVRSLFSDLASRARKEQSWDRERGGD